MVIHGKEDVLLLAQLLFHSRDKIALNNMHQPNEGQNSGLYYHEEDNLSELTANHQQLILAVLYNMNFYLSCGFRGS